MELCHLHFHGFNENLKMKETSFGKLVSNWVKFSLILILYKLENSYIFQLGKSVMHCLKLSIMYASLGHLAAEILVVGNTPLFFSDFSLHSYVYIHIHEYINETIIFITIEKKSCVIAISWQHTRGVQYVMKIAQYIQKFYIYTLRNCFNLKICFLAKYT